MFKYKLGTLSEMEKLWDFNIKDNADDTRWIIWRDQFIKGHESGEQKTFVVMHNDEPIGEMTVVFAPLKDLNDLRLSNGKEIANMSSLRIRKAYEGQGHISKLMKVAEKYAKENGVKALTIGVEANESRNLGIYLHWGFNEFIRYEIDEDEGDALVLYYKKKI